MSREREEKKKKKKSIKKGMSGKEQVVLPPTRLPTILTVCIKSGHVEQPLATDKNNTETSSNQVLSVQH